MGVDQANLVLSCAQRNRRLRRSGAGTFSKTADSDKSSSV